MWRGYAEATLFHAGALKPKQLAFVVNGFARAEVPDRDVFRRLADRALDQVQEFEPRDTALFLNAYAKLAFRDLVLFEQFSKVIRSGEGLGWGEQQLALVANAYARLELADAGLFQWLAQWIVKRVSDFQAQGIATVANAYSKVLVQDKALFAAVAENMDRFAPQLEPRDVANLLNAYARLQLNDGKVLDVLVGQVPARARDLGPVEVAATVGAITKLGLQNPRALLALAGAVKERANELRPRQLSQVVHAFSTLSQTHGRLLQELGPHVAATADSADDQSLVLLFCAYARVGEASGQVMQALLERLRPVVESAVLEPQVLVQLFYACGRLGLYAEALTNLLAGLLRKEVPNLMPQHVANCLFAGARLSLASEEVAALFGALQARLPRGSLRFEQQQTANVLHALAMVHGVGAAPQRFPAPLPGAAVPALVERVLRERWDEHAQLLASAAVSCARLRHGSAPLFALASRTVRTAKCTLSKQGVADLLAAFSVAQCFDLDFFSWALGQFPAAGPGGVPVPTLLDCIGALDYASHAFAGHGPSSSTSSSSSAPPPTAWSQEVEGAAEDGEGSFAGMLFPACPAGFQMQVSDFYVRVGLSLLAMAPQLPAATLDAAAPAFARARLLAAAPFDLLGPTARARAEAAAEAPPQEPLSGPSRESAGEAGEDPAPAARVRAEPPSAGETLLDRLLAELASEGGGVGGAEVLGRRLARYAALLPPSPGSPGDPAAAGAPRSVEVPAAVVDPLLRLMGERLTAQAGGFPFRELAASVATLAQAGVCPRKVLDTLVETAEESFPAPGQLQVGGSSGSSSSPGPAAGDDLGRDLAAVAALCRGLAAASLFPGPRLRACLAAFAESLAAAAGSGEQAGGEGALPARLGPEPLASLASLLSTLHAEGLLTLHVARGLLLLALKEQLLASAEAQAGDTSEQRESANRLRYAELAAFISATLPLADWAAALPAAGAGEAEAAEANALLHDAIVIGTALLARMLLEQRGPGAVRAGPSDLLPLLASLGAAPAASHGACWPGLLTALGERVAAGAQDFGPSSVCACLLAFARLELPGAPWLVANLELAASLARARAACGLDASVAVHEDALQLLGSQAGVPERLPRTLVALMRRALAWQRRLGPTEAAQAAFFCALALDGIALSAPERDEAKRGLAQLLEQLCWDRHRWSQEDRRLVAAVGALLRAEFPELLRGPWVSRSVLSALEAVRRGGAAGVGREALVEVL